MSNLDERIAKLKMQERIEKENKNNESSDKKSDDFIEEKTLEEVITEMKNGKVVIKDKEYLFKNKTYMGGKIEIPIPIAYLEEKINSKETVLLVNDARGISLVANYLKQRVNKQSFSMLKKGMEKQFKDGGLYLEWDDEGKCGIHKDISYGTYKTPTGKGDLYNLIFLKEVKDGIIIGNYNCFYKDLDTFKPIINASVKLMTIR